METANELLTAAGGEAGQADGACLEPPLWWGLAEPYNQDSLSSGHLVSEAEFSFEL